MNVTFEPCVSGRHEDCGVAIRRTRCACSCHAREERAPLASSGLPAELHAMLPSDPEDARKAKRLRVVARAIKHGVPVEFKVDAVIDGAHGARVTLRQGRDGEATITVRPRNRREYSLPLGTVAEIVVTKVIKAELQEGPTRRVRRGVV